MKKSVFKRKTPPRNKFIISLIDFKRKTIKKNKQMNSLVVKGKLSLTIPDKPFSKNQKYIAKQYFNSI